MKRLKTGENMENLQSMIYSDGEHITKGGDRVHALRCDKCREPFWIDPEDDFLLRCPICEPSKPLNKWTEEFEKMLYFEFMLIVQKRRFKTKEILNEKLDESSPTISKDMSENS
jgi:hypothetical protein